MKKILIPSWLCGCLCYTVFNMGSFSLTRMFTYAYGGGSYLYYPTVLMLIYVIYCLLPYGWMDYVWVTVMVISVTCFARGGGGFDLIGCYPYITFYLIPTNWIGFFALGRIVKRNNLMGRIEQAAGKKCFLFIALYAMGTAFYCWISPLLGGISYITYFSLAYESLALMAVFALSVRLSHWHKLSKLLCKVGDETFFIYLYHLNPLQFCMRFMQGNVTLLIVFPGILLALMAGFANLAKIHLNRTRVGKYLWLIGIR